MAGVRWFHSSHGSTQLLDIENETDLITDGFRLVFKNVTGTREGMYECQGQYQNGDSSAVVLKAGCMFIAGKI